MDEITNLKRQVEELMKWKQERERQQITFPLDAQSIDVLQNYFMQVLGKGMFTRVNGTIGDTFFYVRSKNKNDRVGSYGIMLPYTVNISTNVFTAQNHGFIDDIQVKVLSESQTEGVFTSPPSPLDDSTPYYIINATTNTFQLSLTLGGSAIDITNGGTGNNFITLY